jgi:anti-anti-sigma factor
VKILRERIGDAEILRLQGALDARTVAALRLELMIALEHPPRILVFDLAELVEIDSAGIGAFVSALRRMRSSGGDVRILHLVGAVRRLFALLHLDRTMTVCDSLEEALAPQPS